MRLHVITHHYAGKVKRPRRRVTPRTVHQEYETGAPIIYTTKMQNYWRHYRVHRSLITIGGATRHRGTRSYTYQRVHLCLGMRSWRSSTCLSLFYFIGLEAVGNNMNASPKKPLLDKTIIVIEANTRLDFEQGGVQMFDCFILPLLFVADVREGSVATK